jgi:hypothetical protein
MSALKMKVATGCVAVANRAGDLDDPALAVEG